MEFTIGVETCASYDEIVAVLNMISSKITKIKAIFECGGSKKSFDRAGKTNNMLAVEILDCLATLRSENRPSDYLDDETIEAMYQDWLAQEEFKYDAMDATLHHYI